MTLADFQVSYRDNVVIASLTGEIDMSNATDLRNALTEAMPNDALGMVLDLTSVDYVDSAGIHLLYRLGEALRDRGQTFRVVIPPDSPASDALRLAGIKRHVDVVEQVDDGVTAVAGAAPTDR